MIFRAMWVSINWSSRGTVNEFTLYDAQPGMQIERSNDVDDGV